MNEEYRHTVPLNIVAFLGAMGPLKGFADELRSERAKANHKKAERAERLGKLLNLFPEEDSESDDHDHDDDDLDTDGILADSEHEEKDEHHPTPV